MAYGATRSRAAAELAGRHAHPRSRPAAYPYLASRSGTNDASIVIATALVLTYPGSCTGTNSRAMVLWCYQDTGAYGTPATHVILYMVHRLPMARTPYIGSDIVLCCQVRLVSRVAEYAAFVVQNSRW
eukprot:3203626-Rhodomonas_salina.1